ncbi:MAG: phospho-sugar mutase, partial [Acutalibacteraceae bacterium]|nr:phospho-sugar mutase [Acutalibacteraceae bacterium]
LENADAETVAELETIKNDDAEIYDRFYKETEFGTGGMRGVIGAGINRINRYTIGRATLGFARYILKNEGAKDKGIAIAHDNRRKSREFAEVTAGVLAANGIKVFLFDDLRTTPELSFAVRRLSAFGGVVITASHNPAEYNGYKLYDDTGCQLVPSAAQAVIDEIALIQNEFSVNILPLSKAADLVKIIGEEIDLPYYEAVLNLQFDKGAKRNITAVYTPQHGTGNVPVRYVLDRAGFNVIPVECQCNPDPEFSHTKNPNPEADVAYEEALKIMKETSADIAIATDPDCDRLGAVINCGDEYRLLTGNQSGAVILYYILNRMKERGTLPKQGVMFNTVVTSSLGDIIAADFGVETEKTLTGFKFIGDKIKQHEQGDGKKFVFGYEESYGCLIGDFVRDKDAVQASLMFCEAADYYKKQGKNLFDVLNEIYEKYGYFDDNLVSVTLKGAEGAKQITKIMDDLRADKVTELGGMKLKNRVDFLCPPEGFIPSNVLLYNFEDGGFIAVRPSGTEPKCKFYFCIRGKDKAETTVKMAACKKYFGVEK